MRQYLDLMRKIRDEGRPKGDRTGTGTLSLFAEQLRFDLRDGFPLVTTKKTHLKSIAEELLWFLRGETNVKSLQAAGVKIWDAWADEHGELGPVYGHQWRAWDGGPFQGPIDQVAKVIERIKTNPDCRRLIVNAWNVSDLNDMALAPCHMIFQFYVCDGVLSCSMTQRSADYFLGVPFNIASYALLTMMVAHVTGLEAGELIITFGDVHLYSNHMDQVERQLLREPRQLPSMLIDPSGRITSIDGFKYEDFELTGYDPYPAIKAPVAV